MMDATESDTKDGASVSIVMLLQALSDFLKTTDTGEFSYFLLKLPVILNGVAMHKGFTIVSDTSYYSLKHRPEREEVDVIGELNKTQQARKKKKVKTV